MIPMDPRRHYSPPTVAPRHFGATGAEHWAQPSQHHADRVPPIADAEPYSTYIEGSAADVVHSDGKIGKVVAHSTAGSRSVFPVLLKAVASGSDNAMTMDAENGVLTLFSDGNTKYLILDLADLTQDMEFTEVDVCDSGTAKKMLIIGSAPYT